MEKKRIIFIAILIVGNIVVGTPTFYYLGKDTMFEFIAVFTSLSTAAYSILNEPEKPQPLLRVVSKVRGGYGMGSLGFDVYVDNIGDASARDVKVICKTNPTTIALENNGVYTIKVLPAKEPPTRFNVIPSIETSLLSPQKMEVEVTYSNMDNVKQPAIRENYTISELVDKWEKEIMTE